jgi:hypothetical protein
MNEALIDGGAVHMNTSNNYFAADEVVFSGNVAPRNGSALYLSSSNTHCSLTSTVLSDHVSDATSGGGAVYLDTFNDNFIMSGVVGRNNTGAAEGGVLKLATSNNYLKVIDSTFYDNSAQYGGVLYLDHSNIGSTLSNSTLYNNSALISGGAVYLNTLNNGFSIASCVVRDNIAAFNGSALHLQSSLSHRKRTSRITQRILMVALCICMNTINNSP